MLNNLIQDVQDVITGKKPPATPKEKHSVVASYAKWFDVSRERKEKVLYFSEVGASCPRQLWYRYNRSDIAEPLDATTKLKFFYGDMLEELVLSVVSAAGYEVKDEQKVVEHEVGDWKIRGRIDAIINDVLVDVKSTTKQGQRKFDESLDKDPFGYKAQLGGYAHALGMKQAGFLTIQKELGHLGFYPIEQKDIDKFPEMASNAIKTVQSSLDSLEHLEPVKQSETSPNLKLGVTCSYCAYKAECWKDSNGGEGIKTFMYSGRPEFLVKVVKKPKVQEVL